MRIVITGADGQLGAALARRAASHDVVALERVDLDICEPDAVARLAGLGPDLFVNVAAITDVDGCEADPEEAFLVNAVGPRNVGLAAEACGVPLVQVSTDYVFDGSKGAPYVEDDRPSPINVYGASKLAGEQLAAAACSRLFVVRTAWLYGIGGRNFVTRILGLAAERGSLRVVDNEHGSPTFCDDLADGILRLAATGAFGVYHLVNEGVCSRFEFARAILDAAGLADFRLEPTDRFERLARPPAYAPLANVAAARLGVRLPPWRAALDCYFERGGARPAGG